MKSTKRQEFSQLNAPPAAGELSHADKKALAAAAHGGDPTHRFHLGGAGHDHRQDVAASGALQRMRARQAEAR